MNKKIGRSLWEVIKFAAVTLVIVLPIRAYVAQPFVVNGVSMIPSFDNGQYLIIDELSYLLRPPARGEVVIFRYPKNPKTFFIKRLIGLPGETVTIKDNQVFVEKNGVSNLLNEKYIDRQTLADLELTLGAGEYFVMGDNRDQSYDSRYWGAVPEKYIKGRVLARLFPLDKIGLLPADARTIIE